MAFRPSSPLAALDDLEGYRRGFMDLETWRPFVREAFRRHDLGCEAIRPGLAGTFPTFIVDERRVVKFFGPLFEGETCWQVEAEAAALMVGLPELPVARLLACGMLEEMSGWHYLIFACVPGFSLGEVSEQVGSESRLALAGWLGRSLRRMHRLALPPGTTLPVLSPERMRAWFDARWPGDRSKWPALLAGEVEAYLEASAGVIQSGANAFIHADLTRDHLLGQVEAGRWITQALIDFGDAMQGNIYYELAALHLDLFGCDKRLLAAFLEAYGLDPDPDFPRRAMATALLHQFDVLGPLFEHRQELREIQSLDALAACLWDVGTLAD
jgi:hygromycin-B 7''-O-kinase